MDNRHIIIFDGVCNFCNSAVNFIIAHDPKQQFCFTPIQSELAIALAKEHHIDNVGLDTLLLIKNGRCFIWSDAALEICKDLSGWWHLLSIFNIIPGPIRDFCYRFFAKNRYKLFGKRAECMLPNEDVKERFIGT
jgi:predicted DCC family thiol-disulfide oxidoreductase YuxK